MLSASPTEGLQEKAVRPVQGIAFTVYGTPRPQGSSRAFIPKGWNRAVVTTDNAQLKPWRQQIAATAIVHVGPILCFPRHVPVNVTLFFVFTRPKSVSAKKYPLHTRKPDIDKLIRAVFDSLKGIVFHDDSQVNQVFASKNYGSVERVDIEVRPA